MPTKTKPKSKKSIRVPASLVWFDIPADNVNRAQKFYNKLFGWRIEKFPMGQHDYRHIDTGGADASPDGGILKRQDKSHTVTNYIMVASVEQSATKVKKLGGKVVMPKTPVGDFGYFIICQDTEKNQFALWETRKR